MTDKTNPRPQAQTLMERVMGIGEVERRVIGTEPRLRGEIMFQYVALLFCPPVLGYAIFKVAVSLLGMSQSAGLGLAAVVAYGLFLLDRHYLVQARGDSSVAARRAIHKIRAISVGMISISFMLTAADTFHKEIEQVMEATRVARRVELEQTERVTIQVLLA